MPREKTACAKFDRLNGRTISRPNVIVCVLSQACSELRIEQLQLGIGSGEAVLCSRYNEDFAFMTRRSWIEIEYCAQCRWLLRAAWMAQELLTTFEAELGGVALISGTGGIFEVRVDQFSVWSRAEQRRFPEIKELKQLVRDRVAPGRSLGHSDRRADQDR